MATFNAVTGKKGKIQPGTVVLYLVIVLITFLILYPFWYCIAYSLSSSMAVMTQNVTFLPIGFTLENYQNVFKQNHLGSSCLLYTSSASGELSFPFRFVLLSCDSPLLIRSVWGQTPCRLSRKSCTGHPSHGKGRQRLPLPRGPLVGSLGRTWKAPGEAIGTPAVSKGSGTLPSGRGTRW